MFQFFRLFTNQDQVNTFRDEMFLSSLEPFTQNSIEFLNQICQDKEPFTHLKYDSFVALCSNAASDKLEQDFENSNVISKAELRAQISFELCEFYLYDKKYDLARQKVIECRDNLTILRKEYAEKMIDDDNGQEFLFCTFTQEELNGRLMACGIFDCEHANLLYRMNESVMSNYKDIEQIFIEDNKKMEIPLINRRIIELDMEGENAHDPQKVSKDILIRAAALNTLRSCIKSNDLFSSHDFMIKYQKQNGITHLLNVSIAFLKETKSEEFEKIIKQLFHDILLTTDATYLKQSDIDIIQSSGLFTQSELNEIKNDKRLYRTIAPVEDITFSPLCTITDWKLSDVKGKSILNVFQFI